MKRLLAPALRFARLAVAAPLALLAVLSPAAAVAGGPASATIVSVAPTTDRFIIRLRDPSASASARLSSIGVRAGRSFTYLRAMSGGAHVVRMTAGLESAATSGRTPAETNRLVAQQLMLDPEVLYAEPDRILRPSLTPNDSLYPQQWNYFEAAGGINLPAAWDITTGSANIVVAVIDTGIRPHADLAGRTVPGYDFIGDLTAANDGDGRDADPSDPGDGGCGTSSTWHGTHVSGTVGAASNNGLGVTGVNWVSKILPARVLGKCGGYLSDVADAMRWSAGISVPGVPDNPNPARVENLSLGDTSVCSSTFQSAIDDVVARGTVVVVAAGNENQDAANTQPAGCNNVIAVGATTRNGGRASFSNFGSKVALSAPGAGILSTVDTGSAGPVGDGYASYSGTSMSTPHVAGVVALMLSQNPALTPAQVKARLQATARAFPTGTGADCTTAVCGAGIVDAAAALVQGATARVNMALQSNGAVASASTSYNGGYPAAAVNNGERKGANAGNGGYWNDSTPNTFPDWVRIDFPRATTIGEIDVYSVQDNYTNPVEPTDAMTFNNYGLVNFDVQYWDGSNWVTVPGGSINGNNLIARKVTFTPVTTTAIRVYVRGSPDLWSRITEIEAYGDAAPVTAMPPVNVARPANGGSATASTTHSSGYPPSGAIDGDRRGLNWGSGSGWNDGTPNTFPDYLQVNFSGTKSITEIDVFGVQDNYQNPSEPTASMTFTRYGLIGFDLQYWNGSSWQAIPGGSVDGNNLVWRKFTFPAISTNAVRLTVRNTPDLWSRVAEIEVYAAP